MSYSPVAGMVTVGRLLVDGDTSLQHRHIVRCFMHKLAQVVVQSRYGNKPITQEKNPDWEFVLHDDELQHVCGLADSKFHMDLLDNVEISEHFERLLGDWYLTPGNAFTVQILVRTVDGDMFVAEMWSLVMSERPSSAPSRHNDLSQLYTKLAGLLKSVKVASRITPGFRQSFYQSASSYIMFYTITTAPPNLKRLGSDCDEHIFPAVSCSEGLYRVEAHYRTSYIRDRDFNCSILHRDMYYSSLASLNDACIAGTTPPHHSSDVHLDRPMDQTTLLDRHFFAATTTLHQRHYQPPARHRPGMAPPDTRLGTHHPWPNESPKPQQKPGARRVSLAVCRPQTPSPTPVGEVVCSSLPARMHTAPHSPSSSPTQPSKHSPRRGSSRLPKSPPSDIPRQQDSSCRFPDAASAPPSDMYVVPRVSLPPGDLFASIMHGTHTTTLSDSYLASDDDDEDSDQDLTARLAADTAGPARSAGSTGERAIKDYVMVEMANPPAFVDSSIPECELGVFYLACQNAPALFTSPSSSDIAGHGSSGSNTSNAAVHNRGSYSPRGGGVPPNYNISPTCNIDRPKPVVQRGFVDQEELFSGKPNSFGAEVLLDDEDPSKRMTPMELRLKQFEDNLGHFNILIESLHSSSELDPS